MKDLLGIGDLSTNSLETVKLIYPDLAQPGIKKVGLALETVLDFSNTILLPLKLVNEKSKFFFQRHMENYKEKLNKVPEEQIGTVTPEIGLPILDELLRVTNDDLADLFTNLLVNASTVNGSQYAHPSFINIIKSLSADEARIVKYLSEISNPSELVIFIRFEKVDSMGSVPLTKEFNNLNNLVPLDFKENDGFYINNLINLGILQPQNIYYRDAEKLYKDLEANYQELYKLYLDELNKGIRESLIQDTNTKLNINRGSNKITEYGESLFKSIT
ncbi:DUF4393 domain-containing protein [Peribacillus butanolivorans]|uniref:DUF4393 domain-containing protein n=1 Tax=Peribacillus butanolivorans TaxID=421767 RepID=UPI0035E161CC